MNFTFFKTFTAIAVVLSICPSPARAQGPFSLKSLGKEVVFGVSPWYVFDGNKTKDIFYYRQFLLNTNAAVSLTSALDVGVARYFIWGKERLQPVNQYDIFGAFLQYDFLYRRERSDLFLEFGLHKGNLCECSDDAPPLKIPNLAYYTFTWGYEGLIRHPLHWEFSMTSVNTFKRINGALRNQFLFFNLGLNYHLRFKN
jgi:hypothetical protein